LTVIGSLLGLIFCTLAIPLFIPFVPAAYEFLKNWIGWILVVVVIFMILNESDLNKKFWGFVQFMMTGILGLIVLNYQNLEQPLFPMLSGLFGISMLIVSLSEKSVIPKQRITEIIKIPNATTARAVGAGTISGAVAGFFPGLGPAQVAMLGSQIAGNVGIYGFLILVGCINTVNMVFSLTTLYALNKARNGAVLAVIEIMKSITLNDLVVFISVALIAGGIAAMLALGVTRIFANLINKVNYQMLCILVIFLVTALVIYFSSWLGLLVLIVSTAMGIVPNILKIKRSHSMGCLLLPVILYFLL
jgi:putative membrane protein